MEIRDLILLAYYLTLGVLALYGLHRALLLRARAQAPRAAGAARRPGASGRG